MPATALSHISLKYSYPFAVLSIIIILSGVLGTACNKPVIVAFLSPSQNANSDKCNAVNVSERPIPFPPAVIHFILLSRPVPWSLLNTSSFALDFFCSGLISSGKYSNILLLILNKFVVESSLCATIPAL